MKNENSASREKVGKISHDILTSPNLDTKQPLLDTSLEMQKNIVPQIEECVKNHTDWTDPFYVVIINKRERLMVNVIRQYFIGRKTLPTSDYDQTVFKYFPNNGDLKFLWTVPDKESVAHIILNAKSLPSDHSELIRFCKLFVSSKLEKECGE